MVLVQVEGYGPGEGCRSETSGDVIRKIKGGYRMADTLWQTRKTQTQRDEHQRKIKFAELLFGPAFNGLVEFASKFGTASMTRVSVGARLRTQLYIMVSAFSDFGCLWSCTGYCPGI